MVTKKFIVFLSLSQSWVCYLVPVSQPQHQKNARC